MPTTTAGQQPGNAAHGREAASHQGSAAKRTETIRVVSWNVAYRGLVDAAIQAAFLKRLAPDLVLLQDINQSSLHVLQSEGGFEWLKRSSPPPPPISRGRSSLCAIGGSLNVQFLSLRGPFKEGLPERVLVATTRIAGTKVAAASYYAPPGVSWHASKPAQAVEFAKWLKRVELPVVFGADANTPAVDHPDFSMTRTHWNSGMHQLHGKPGDDLLFGPGKIHALTDALRTWLGHGPDRMAQIRAETLHGCGPLEVSYKTGARKGFSGNPRRYDSVWASGHFAVEDVQYLYRESLEARSDHAAVVVDLCFRSGRQAGF